MVALALVHRHRSGHRLDPRRDGSHDRRQHRRPAGGARQRTGHHVRSDHRDRRRALRDRRLYGSPVLGSSDRHLRPQEALPDHSRRLPRRHRADRGGLRHLVVLPLPLPHRIRYRRRVRGHQLRDRRADPGVPPRARRPDHQRQLLAGSRRWCAAVDRRAEHVDLPGERRLAADLRPGSRPVPGDPPRTTSRPRESAVAADPRPGGGGRTDRQERREAHRGRRRRAHHCPPPRAR